LVRVEIAAANGDRVDGVALLDTGASRSAIDRIIARELELPSPGAASWFAISQTAEAPDLAPLRRGVVRVHGAPNGWVLDLIEVPRLSDALDGYEIIALLGWDVLDQCRLTTDGPGGAFTLEIPPSPRAARRRR